MKYLNETNELLYMNSNWLIAVMNVDVSILYPVFAEFNDGKNGSCGKYDIMIYYIIDI